MGELGLCQVVGDDAMLRSVVREAISDMMTLSRDLTEVNEPAAWLSGKAFQ